MTSAASFIVADRVGYAYGTGTRRRVLDGIDLTVGEDAYLLVSGRSGCGKSTLCRTFNGLIPHFYSGQLTGTVTVDGQSTAGLSVAQLFDRVGMVFQNPEAQLFNRSVAREIAFGLESLGLERGEIGRRIAEIAAAVGIGGLLERHPHSLSGGEQHLTAIAAILALRPRLLVLDEPFANLDPVNVRRMRLVLDRVSVQGCSLVVCEHRLGLTAPDAERMVVIDGGRIAAAGPPSEVLGTDVAAYGLEAPLAARASRRLGLAACHLDIEGLPLSDGAAGCLADLLPSPAPAGRGGDPVLVVDGLAARVAGRQVLRDVNFGIGRGEVVALVGANGAGKTTLVRHLNGLVKPGHGRVVVAGKDTGRFATSVLARHIGIAFQNPNSQFFKLTVADEIRVAPRALGGEDEPWLAELARRLQLEDLMARAPFRLSSGEKKRVAFAAALASRPDVLVLDEPTAGQDAFFRRALAALLTHLAADGTAVLMVTHDLAFAERTAGRWLVLCDGTIAADSTPAAVMADAALLARSGLLRTDAACLAARLGKIGHG
ncbi:MAG: ATP-binding cassette domain-containing protein [Desulfobacterales bacterium]|nr:ATP-binding cassette domain-containing protein [Desulfobacterales bacterium]